ncbi:1-deoxy-D-xylulose-5-phosphate reductoisomerase, partial [bacterium]|nr:1-deoxy-D-xylulose-5-phosphate reductoisomerase [bacterium]
MQQERLTLLGATGSVGQNTCAVVAAFPQRFTLKYLTAHRNWEKLLSLSRKFHPHAVALTGLSPNLEIEKAFQSIG